MTPSRTSVRLVEVADAAALAGHFARDAKEFARWQPARPEGFDTPSHQAGRIEQLLATHSAGSAWPGVIVADGEVVGQVAVSSISRGPLRKGFLSYWVATPFQGQGHATRAVGLTLRVMTGELGLRRAEAHTQTDNLPSHRVLKNNGFSSWGIAHAHIFMDGAWRDEIFWERNLADGEPGR
ncbi:GNAT family protein [Streptomyces sp. SL13]|uniref:GNAT family protein n=1 Tax=Streptantibioticus silvisoli TaxID=2705255 RepID=A0AA90GYW5_9ACTN|nr:GNAT family protein [Streptantibioticus silvisoli]MDI5966645.1 GNAT family protein [Streptantibioticus silvisoli]MDI5970803.1 GNAT family protein [Streptantibioticus silvisoli]